MGGRESPDETGEGYARWLCWRMASKAPPAKASPGPRMKVVGADMMVVVVVGGSRGGDWRAIAEVSRL